MLAASAHGFCMADRCASQDVKTHMFNIGLHRARPWTVTRPLVRICMYQGAAMPLIRHRCAERFGYLLMFSKSMWCMYCAHVCEH